MEINLEEGENDADENVFDDDLDSVGQFPLHLQSQIRDPTGNRDLRDRER